MKVYKGKNLSAMFHKGILTTLCCVLIILCSSCGKQLEDEKVDEVNSDITKELIRVIFTQIDRYFPFHGSKILSIFANFL